MELGERIKSRRIELGLSQEELAEMIGYKSRSAIGKIETNANGITQSKIIAFAKALKCTPSYLMGWEEETEDIPKHDNIIQITKKRVPLLGSIACGKPILANEDVELYVECGADIQADFALHCKGDSMINARILDGDIVFIRKQNIVNNGEIAAVIINDEATLKRVYYYPESNKIVLNAENPSFEPLVYLGSELENVRILGKAVAFQSDVR